MIRPLAFCSTFICVISLAGAPRPAMSQNVTNGAVSALAAEPPAEGLASPLAARLDKPTVTVIGFESGTVSAQVNDRHGFSAFLAAMRGDNNTERYDPSQLGTGIADMLIAKLLESGEFRLLERKASDSANHAQFIVTGSVTKFGFEEHNFGGFAASMATMGLLSYKQHKTKVSLTARVINAATGEIVASMTAGGVSNKGGGLRFAGLGSAGGGGADISSSNFRATAIGEATERAVANLAERIVQKKSTF